MHAFAVDVFILKRNSIKNYALTQFTQSNVNNDKLQPVCVSLCMLARAYFAYMAANNTQYYSNVCRFAASPCSPPFRVITIHISHRHIARSYIVSKIYKLEQPLLW